MPPMSTPMATATNTALNRITWLSPRVPGKRRNAAYPRSATVLPEAADMLGHRVLSRRGRRARRAAAQRGLAEAGLELWLGRWCRRWHGRELAAVGDTGLKIAELSLQVRLEPAAVLTLERAQVIDPALKLLALRDQGAAGLAGPLLCVTLQGLGTCPGVTGDLLRLAAGLGDHLVGFAACPAERLVRLAAGVGDRLVGGLLREREHAGRRVHVVLNVVRPVHHVVGAPHRLLHGRLWHHHVRLGVGQRGAEGHGWLAPAA